MQRRSVVGEKLWDKFLLSFEVGITRVTGSDIVDWRLASAEKELENSISVDLWKQDFK